jgi:hypothetical protein
MADQTKEVVTYTITLTKTTPPQTWYERYDNFQLAPFLGTITSVHIFFPPGCEDLVKVRFGAGDDYITEWITSADGKSITIPLNKLVAKDTPIFAEIMNFDTTYPHTPTCEVILVEATAQVLKV